MICKHCGAQMDEEMNSCPVCGKEAAAEPEVQEPAAEATGTETVRTPETDCAEPAEETVEEAAEEITEAVAEEADEAFAEEAVGEVLEETPVRKKPKLWVLILAIAGGVILLGVLVCAVLYGLGVDLRPRANDIYFRDSYTVDDEKAAKMADTVVATVEDLELTNSELQVYYWMSVTDFLNNYSYYLSYIGLDYTKPLDEQTCYFDPTMTWQQFLLDNAISTWHRYNALILKSQEENFELSQVLQDVVNNLGTTVEETAVDGGYESAQDMLRQELGAGCTVDGYLGFWSDYYNGLGYFNGVYDSMLPTDEEVEQYFTENEEALAASGITRDAGRYADVRHILIMPKGGTTDENNQTIYNDEEWAACLEAAEKVYDEWKKGAATEESFAELAGKYSEDPGSASNGGLYQQVYPGQMVPEFEMWTLDAGRQYGDHGIVQTPYGYHIMFFVDGEDIWLAESRTSLLSERTNTMVEEAMEQWPKDVNYKKIILGEVSLTN